MKSVTPMDVVDEVVDDVEEEEDEEEEGEDGSVDDIFGGGGGHCQRIGGSLYLARARPTMISAKYRLKEERRKVLKISVAKLKRIDDPESSLRRSVLINNTVRRLQREARDEKMQRQQTVTSPYHHLLRPLIASPHDSHPSSVNSPVCSPTDPSPKRLVEVVVASAASSSPLDAPDLALTLPDLSDALVDDDPLPPRLSVDSLDGAEGLDDSSDSLSTPSSSPADPSSALLQPPSAAPRVVSSCPDASTTSDPTSPPYIGFDSMDASFPAADTEASDVFSPKGILDSDPSSALSSGSPEPAPSASPLSCYDVVASDGSKAVSCDSLSDEEEREACGALVNCLDELVQVTSMCREDGEGLDGVGKEVGERDGVSKVQDEDDEEVEDVHSVLSQFYMPPTPRMLTSIDDEEEEEGAVVSRVEEEVAAAVEAAVEAAVVGRVCREDGDAGEAMVIASARQCGLPEPRSSLDVCCEENERSRKRPFSCGEDSLLLMDEFSQDMVALEKESAKRQRLSDESRQSSKKVSQARPRRIRSSSLRDGDVDSENSQATQFSCGHSSIFGELQSVVFHSLIASLES